MYVYKLASHDKCQYAILNKEQKDTTDSRRVSSPPLTCRDTHTLTRRAFIIISSFTPCRFLPPPRVSLHAVLKGENADWSFGHPPLGVSQPALQLLVHRAGGEGVAAAESTWPEERPSHPCSQQIVDVSFS